MKQMAGKELPVGKGLTSKYYSYIIYGILIGFRFSATFAGDIVKFDNAGTEEKSTIGNHGVKRVPKRFGKLKYEKVML